MAGIIADIHAVGLQSVDRVIAVLLSAIAHRLESKEVCHSLLTIHSSRTFKQCNQSCYRRKHTHAAACTHTRTLTYTQAHMHARSHAPNIHTQILYLSLSLSQASSLLPSRSPSLPLYTTSRPLCLLARTLRSDFSAVRQRRSETKIGELLPRTSS